MDLVTILITILVVIIVLFLIAGVILTILILKTLKDIKKIIEVSEDVIGNIKEKKYSEIVKNPEIKSRIVVLVSSRFGLFAPIAEIIITKIVAKKLKDKVVK